MKLMRNTRTGMVVHFDDALYASKDFDLLPDGEGSVAPPSYVGEGEPHLDAPPPRVEEPEKPAKKRKP